MDAPARLSDLDSIIGNIISSVLTFAGLAFVVMLIIGGFNYLQVGKNREAAAKAQRSLTFAFLGLVVSLCAWIILRIIGTFLGIPDISTFTICIEPPC